MKNKINIVTKKNVFQKCILKCRKGIENSFIVRLLKIELIKRYN